MKRSKFVGGHDAPKKRQASRFERHVLAERSLIDPNLTLPVWLPTESGKPDRPGGFSGGFVPGRHERRRVGFNRLRTCDVSTFYRLRRAVLKRGRERRKRIQ